MIPTPRPYQRDGLDAVGTSLANGVMRQLLQSPTGTGKTVLFAAMLEWHSIKAWLAQFPKHERRMLVIAHRKELLNQAAEKIQRANPELIVTIDQASRVASVHSDVVVAGIQTLQSNGFARLQRLTSRMQFRVVIIDEAHHAAARTYREALALLGILPAPPPVESDEAMLEGVTAWLGRQTQALDQWDQRAPKDRLLLGVTATPNRSDAVGLSCVFQSIVFSYPLRKAIADGYLVNITPWAIDTETSLDDVRTNRGEFVQSALAEAVNTPGRNALALAAWQELAERVPTIVFTVDVAHAHDMAATWIDAGYRAKAISGETPDDERAATLAEFSRGDLDAVMNCMVLTEGTDLPITGCILHAKPTKSATLYEQMTGRGLRPLPGDPVGPERLAFTGTLKKTDCIVIDIVDVSRRHSLQTAPVLYGLPIGLATNGDSLEKMADELDKLIDEFQGFDVEKVLSNGQHLTLAQLRARAELVDLWRVPSLPPELSGLRLRWMKAGDDVFQVEYPWNGGYERVRVERDMLDHWSITLRFTPPVDPVTGVRGDVRQLLLGDRIATAEAATGLAEAYVQQQRPDIARLRSKDAPWRQVPASIKQLETLLRRRIPHDPKKITKGQASDLLDLANARRR